MLKVYPGIIHEEDGSYWIEFPDLPGCSTFGDSLAECLDMAEEALGLYLATLIENGDAVPTASNIVDIKAKDGQTTYITTDVNKYRRDTKAVKKMVSIPSWLAKEAEMHNLSLSKTLQEALHKKIV